MTFTLPIMPLSPTAGTGPSCGANLAAAWHQVSVRYGATLAVDRVSLEVPRGAVVALLGPSGCGKTSMLNTLAGVTPLAAGRVEVAGRDVSALPPEARGIGVVFQNYALFPHLSALENTAFGLTVRGVPRRERRLRAAAELEQVGLSVADFTRKPHALSGGQQQRVALARALCFGPEVLLLDEPFANLDRNLHTQLRADLRALTHKKNIGTVLITHDAADAFGAADIVAILAAGRLVQVGAPADVYRRPLTPFAAHALGPGSIWPATHFGRERGFALVRNEQWQRTGGDFQFDGWVSNCLFAGAHWTVEVRTPAGELTLYAPAPIPVHEPLSVVVAAIAVWFFPDAPS